MGIKFNSFKEWENHCQANKGAVWQPVLQYEIDEKERTEEEIWHKLDQAFAVMKDAVHTGLEHDMKSISGMIDNGAKKVMASKVHLISPEFTRLLAYTLAAKEVNSCMGRVVAAPTAGASGIMPGILTTLQELHQIPNRTIYESMLVAAGIALIIERRASIAGAVGGCQAETGTAAAMGAGAIVYAMGGTLDQIFDSVAITIMNMLGLICDPIAGLVEVPCVKRNGSGAVIAFSSAQMALSGDKSIIPVDEVIDAMGEVGMSMEEKYKETALGGLAATPTAREIEKRVLVHQVEEIEEEEAPL
ncbi:MAG: L-serine ammonia-lyase, iron-sulfur-dependent, subunit alpha [Bacteroidia bacterium]|nr:L-serine ammonia-lyase, iron-sulfur-dependent, subunit alpha [Bacteroidia bacterium]